jgi:hypothetical protein
MVLCNRNRKDLDDPTVVKINTAYLSSLHGAGTLTVDQAVELLQKDRPDDMWGNEFRLRIRVLLRGLTSREEGKAQLRKLFRKTRRTLKARLPVLVERERLDGERAMEQAKVSVDKDGMNRARYSREHVSQARMALNQLSKMVKERLKRGDDGLDEAESPSEGSDTAETAAADTPGTPSAEAEKAVYRSEPIVPQVPCGATTQSDEIGGSATPPGGLPPDGFERARTVPAEAASEPPPGR